MTEGFRAEHRARVENWNRLLPLRDEVLKSLETARQEKVIGAPLEASVRLSADDTLLPLLENYAAELPGLFIVSKVALSRQTDSGIGVKIDRAPGTKCERCWKYTDDVGSDAELPSVCASCAQPMRENRWSRLAGETLQQNRWRPLWRSEFFTAGPVVEMDD